MMKPQPKGGNHHQQRAQSRQQQQQQGSDQQDNTTSLNNSMTVTDLGYMNASGTPQPAPSRSSRRRSSKYDSEEFERTSFMYNMEKSENQVYGINHNDDDSDDDTGDDEENQQRRRHEDLGFHIEDGDDEDASRKAAQCSKSRLLYYSTVRIIVVIVVIILAALLSYLAYKFARDQETDTFEAKFQDFADEIIRSSTNNARHSRVILESFSRTVTSLAIFANTTWPLLTLPHYESRAYDYITISKAESITFAPVVPMSLRERYENYTLHNQEWIQQGIDYEYLTHLQSKKREQLRQEENFLDDNNNDKEVTIEPTTIAPGTNMEGFSILNKAKPIQPFIWTYAEFTHRAIADLGPGPYVPVWQTYPPPRNSYVVGNNLMNAKSAETQKFQQLIESASRANQPTLSDIFDNNFFLFGNAQTIDVDPKSVILQPIFRKMLSPGQGFGGKMRNNDIVGYMVVIKKWHQIFQDVLYMGAKPIIVVLRNSGPTCPNTKEFTYRVDGPNGRFLGKGDLHDKRYDDLEMISPLFQSSQINSGCNYTLHIYPTRELEDDYMTDLPIIVLLTVLSFCTLLAAGAYVYDRINKQHQRNRLKAIAQQEQALLRIDHARQAAASERQLNEFIAHEVRNPLSAAMSACSFVSSAVHELTTTLTTHHEEQDELQDEEPTTTSTQTTNTSTEQFEEDHQQQQQPLFSIPTTTTTAPPPPPPVAVPPPPPPPVVTSTPDHVEDGKKQEQISTPVAPAPLFSIVAPSVRKEEEEEKPPQAPVAPLFEIGSSTSNQMKEQQSQSKPAPLFALASNTAAQQQTKPAPLFPIASNTAAQKQQTQPGPLFAIASNTTSKQQQTKPAPLFPIVTTTTPKEAEGDKKEEQPKTTVAPLFPIASATTATTAAAAQKKNDQQQQQPVPLFQIAPTKNDNTDASIQKEEKCEEPKQPAPLFQIAGTRTQEKDAETQEPQAPAPLFQIASTQPQDKEAKPKPQALSPLFQIATAATNTSIPPPPPATTATTTTPSLLTTALSESKLQLQQQRQQQVQEQKDSIMEDLHIIDSSLQFINELLRNMLDVQRAAHHQLKIEKAPTDVFKDILEPVDAMLYRRGKSEVKVIVECPQDIMVSTDRLRLKQVVLNLSRNSAKFVEKGYIKLKVVVMKGHVQIWIEDTGPGIPEEKKGKLFAKFQESLDSLSQGTGLGLSLCKILIGLLDGDVYLDEKYDSGYEGRPGARFIINLRTPPLQLDDETESRELSSEIGTNGHHQQSPRGPPTTGGSQRTNSKNSIQQEHSDVEKKPPQGGGSNAQKKQHSAPTLYLPQNLKVLFVDDDTVLRKLFVRATRRIVKGWELSEAASGEAALRLIDEFDDGLTHFDLIFMDQYMASTEKQLLGTETTQALRSKGVKSKIVGLSANDMANDFFAAGANAFICKPLPAQQDTLREVFDEILNPASPSEQAPGGQKKQSLVFKPPSGDYAV